MTSGIYKLEFGDKHFYIGKSKDIERRWKEHDTKFEKGTAAKFMQEAFNCYGYPSREIMFEVHPEHLDVIEPILIHNNWNEYILNTTHEDAATDMKNEYLELCKNSLGTLCQFILGYEKQAISYVEDKDILIKLYETKLRKTKNGSLVKELESQVEAYKTIARDKDRELNKLKSRSFFQRLFNL